MRFQRIIIAMLMLFTVVFTASCSVQTALTPRDAVDGFCFNFSKGKIKTAFEYVDEFDGFGYNEDDPYISKMIREAAKTTEFEILEVTDSENPVRVKTRITTVDLREVFKQSAQSMLVNTMDKYVEQENELNAEDIEEAFSKEVISRIKESGAPTVTTDISFKLTQSDGKWFVIMDDYTANVVCGYINEAGDYLLSLMSADSGTSSDENADVSSDSAEDDSTENETSSEELAQ